MWKSRLLRTQIAFRACARHLYYILYMQPRERAQCVKCVSNFVSTPVVLFKQSVCECARGRQLNSLHLHNGFNFTAP